MPVIPANKYALKSLHDDIGLMDRKLAHLLKYETFSSEKDRTQAVAKLSLKRGQLVRSAQAMASDGIEFNPSDLPLSLRAESEATPGAMTQASESALNAPAQA